jgi:hypothetical protein
MSAESNDEARSTLQHHVEAQAAVIENHFLCLRATSGSTPTLVLSAKQGDTWIPVLSRAGANRVEGGALRATFPDDPTFEVTRLARSVCLVVRGKVPGGRLSLAIWLDAGASWLHVTETLNLDRTAPPVAELAAQWSLESWEAPGEVFSPHLTPEEDDVIGAHCLRSPVLVAQDARVAAAMVYDVDSLKKQHLVPAFMLMTRRARDAPQVGRPQSDGAPSLVTGLVGQRVRGHVLFRATYEPVDTRDLAHSYRLFAASGLEPGAALLEARRHVWEHSGKPSLSGARPLRASAPELALEIYPRVMAQKWRETRIDGRRAGAITTDRAFPSDVWMCPWFHNLTTGYGLYAWGEKLGQADFVDQAIAMRELHFAAPMDRGLFPTLYVFGDGESTGRWAGSHPQGGGLDVLHVEDMSYTMYWLLLFHRDLLADPRTLERSRAYLSALRGLARKDGGLPAYVSQITHQPVTRIDMDAWKRALREHPGGDDYISDTIDRWGTERFVESAEDAASLMFVAELLKMPDLDPQTRQDASELAAALAQWITLRVVDPAWYVDFEVHWSCAPNPLGLHDRRSGQHPQNLLAIYMAAQGLATLFETTHDPMHLAAARRAMDRLSLYQQVYDPPFLGFDALGGYPAQNTDGEWSDARQALFVPTHVDFHRLTGDAEHLERARAACRASFATLFHPAVCDQYPVGWSRTPMGLAAENHAHGGIDRTCGVSSFHWGAGSALMAAAYLERRNIALW